MIVQKKKIISLLLLFVLVCMAFYTVIPVSYAAYNEDKEFDKTNVLDDLRSSSDFNILNYPFDDTGLLKKPFIVCFVEYCYSYKVNLQGNYGLYVYFYNPQNLDIVTNSRGNKIQIAVSYNSVGMAKDFEKFDLKFCNKSVESDYYGLFYKFKVIDHKSKDGKTILQRVNSHERRYDVSGIELFTKGNQNATDYAVGGIYKFTGYAKGYGPDENAESTLDCKVESLEVVSLDLNHTFYRTLTSSQGSGYQNQIDTVYFAVPKRLFDTYGKLQRIKAEWYEYKTKDVVVTSDSELHNALMDWRGRNITVSYNIYGFPNHNYDVPLSVGTYYGRYNDTLLSDWCWNPYGNSAGPNPILYYSFLVDDIKNYDPQADISNIGGVESDALYNYIVNYDGFFTSYLNGPSRNIPADLFEGDIDEYRKKETDFGKIDYGYSYYDFDADTDLQKILTWKDTDPSFWDNVMAWGLWNTLFDRIPSETGRIVSPLYTLKSSDLIGTDKEVSERLLVHSKDVSILRSFYAESQLKQSEVVLFRFAVTDYFAQDLVIVKAEQHAFTEKEIYDKAYRAWGSVFFDFDVIQLTFKKGDVYHVIPVVASPIDVLSAITPPYNPPKGLPSWVTLLLIFLALLILLVLLAPIIPYIIKGVVWVVSAPFKVVRKIAKKSKQKKRK